MQYRGGTESAGRFVSGHAAFGDMADLQPAFLDNIIYVTTKENAKRLEQEAPKRREAAPSAE